MDLSIVIPVFNRLDLTRQCLRVLAEHRPAVDHEVIVVDNGSTDGSGAWLADAARSWDDARLVIVSNATNLGFAGGCNAGVRAASGEVVCLLNNDIEVAEGFADRHVEVLAADAAVGVVGSLLHYPDGRIQHAGVVLCDDRRHDDPLMAVHRFHQQPNGFAPASVPMLYPAVTAALMSVRRTQWESLGGLDDGYWNGYEDVDLCLRFGVEGARVVYDPRSQAVHHESQSGEQRWSGLRHNIERFHERWVGRVKPDVIIAADGTPRPTPDAHFAPYELPVAVA